MHYLFFESQVFLEIRVNLYKDHVLQTEPSQVVFRSIPIWEMPEVVFGSIPVWKMPEVVFRSIPVWEMTECLGINNSVVQIVFKWL